MALVLKGLFFYLLFAVILASALMGGWYVMGVGEWMVDLTQNGKHSLPFLVALFITLVAALRPFAHLFLSGAAHSLIRTEIESRSEQLDLTKKMMKASEALKQSVEAALSEGEGFYPDGPPRDKKKVH